MKNLLLALCMGGFGAIVFLNVYFRLKVLKSYRYLMKHRVEFGRVHIFNRERLEKEVLQRYPEHRPVILRFINNMRFSINMATVLTTIITIFAAILMFMREEG